MLHYPSLESQSLERPTHTCRQEGLTDKDPPSLYWGWQLTLYFLHKECLWRGKKVSNKIV